MLLHENTTNRYKYKFHLEIEKGNFEIFQHYSTEQVFFAHKKANLYEHRSHKTLQSILNYFDKNFKKKEVDQSIEKWNEIIKLGINFNKDMNYGYGFNYSMNFSSFNIPFNNFVSLISYNFSGKLNKLEIEIMKYALANTELDKIPPIYVINECKNPVFFNLYLEELKERYPTMDFGEGMKYFKADIISDPDLYSHFFSLASKKEFLINNIIDLFQNLPINYIQKHISNDIDMYKLTSHLKYILDQDMPLSRKNDIFSLILDKIKEDGIDISILNLKNFYKYPNQDIINRLIQEGVSYKQDFKTHIYSNLNIKNDDYAHFLIKNNLWDFNSKNSENLNYIEYHNEKIKKQKSKFDYSYRFSSLHLLETIDKIKNTKIIDLDFLDQANDKIKNDFYQNIVSYQFVDENVLNNYFKKDKPKFILDFILNSSEEDSLYRNLIQMNYLPNFFNQNETNHFNFMNNIQKLKDEEQLIFMFNSIRDNLKEEYLKNNIEVYYKNFLDLFEKCSNIGNYVLKIDKLLDLKLFLNFIKEIITENNYLDNKHNQTIINIIRNINACDNMDKNIDPKKELEKYQIKDINYQKELIAKDLVFQNKNLNNKKRI